MADARSSCDAVVLRRGGDHGSFPTRVCEPLFVCPNEVPQIEGV